MLSRYERCRLRRYTLTVGAGLLSSDHTPARRFLQKLQRRVGDGTVECRLFGHAVQPLGLQQLAHDAGLHRPHAIDDSGRLNPPQDVRLNHERRHRERVIEQELQRLGLLRFDCKEYTVSRVLLLRVHTADDVTTWPISVVHWLTMRPYTSSSSSRVRPACSSWP